jgi:hypothetical protein
MPILGQVPAKPLIGDTWAQAKAFWFSVWDYKIQVPQVKAFHESEARTLIASAPARTSKSFAAAHDTLVYGMPTRPLCSSLHWSVGPTYETNKEFEYWWHRLVDQRERLSVGGARPNITRAINNPGNGRMEIVIEWGKDETGSIVRSIFKGMSSTNERSLQGEEVTTAILSEAAEHPSHILTKYVGTRSWRILLPTTPKPHADWIRDMIEQGEKEPRLGIASFTFPAAANPLYNKERFEEERRKAEIRVRDQVGPKATAEDDPYFAEQFLGKWVYYTGSVLPFSENRHVKVFSDVDIDGNAKFVSCDYGYEDPSVALFWAVRPNGDLIIFDEIYERHLTTPKFVAKIKDRMSELDDVVYVTGDPQNPQVSAIMQEEGLPVISLNKKAQRDRAAGTRRLIDLLVGSKDGKPDLYVDSGCENTIREWNHLRFREGMRNEYSTAAIQGDDHSFDAARYGVMTRPEPLAEYESKDWLEVARWDASDRATRFYYPEGIRSWH